MSAYTKGPLTVKVTERWPFNIETLDAEGDVIFSTRMPCNSTRDKSADDAINCVNFPGDKRAEYAAINRRAVADDVLRAAAPDLLEALESVLDSIGALTKRHELYGHMSEKEADQVFAAIAKARGEA